jgi:hypothetical protein
MLNVYLDDELASLSGVAGSKSGSYTSKQTGAIMAMAQQIYQKHYKNASGANSSIANIGLTYSSDTQLLSFAKELANQLKEINVSYG